MNNRNNRYKSGPSTFMHSVTGSCGTIIVTSAGGTGPNYNTYDPFGEFKKEIIQTCKDLIKVKENPFRYLKHENEVLREYAIELIKDMEESSKESENDQ